MLMFYRIIALMFSCHCLGVPVLHGRVLLHPTCLDATNRKLQTNA
jgi:hypothetical protein